eukprot:1652925-Amphidinium_carterae.1
MIAKCVRMTAKGKPNDCQNLGQNVSKKYCEKKGSSPPITTSPSAFLLLFIPTIAVFLRERVFKRGASYSFGLLS